MAITRKEKDELINQYVEWMKASKGLVLTNYTGLSMKQIDELRAKVRESGGEFHIMKNTLGKIAFERMGWSLPADLLDGSTAVAFAFRDAPTMAKTLTDFVQSSEFVKVKGGYLENRPISAAEVKALADLPPLPVMRAQLLGTLIAPASKLARTLAEPARALAAVLKAYADKDTTPAAA